MMLGVMGIGRFIWISSGYILMLAVMTYNTGVFIAISAGLAIGYGVFSQHASDNPKALQELNSKDDPFFRLPNS